jgi:pyruvate formate lyase activating enzyme
MWVDRPTVRKALLYESVRGGFVRCLLCERRCLISEGSTGFCGTRVNVDGVLYTLVYGDINAISVNPIEKGCLF